MCDVDHHAHAHSDNSHSHDIGHARHDDADVSSTTHASCVILNTPRGNTPCRCIADAQTPTHGRTHQFVYNPLRLQPRCAVHAHTQHISCKLVCTIGNSWACNRHTCTHLICCVDGIVLVRVRAIGRARHVCPQRRVCIRLLTLLSAVVRMWHAHHRPRFDHSRE